MSRQGESLPWDNQEETMPDTVQTLGARETPWEKFSALYGAPSPLWGEGEKAHNFREAGLAHPSSGSRDL